MNIYFLQEKNMLSREKKRGFWILTIILYFIDVQRSIFFSICRSSWNSRDILLFRFTRDSLTEQADISKYDNMYMKVPMITFLQQHQLSKCCILSVFFPCFIYSKYCVFTISEMTFCLFPISFTLAAVKSATHSWLKNNNKMLWLVLEVFKIIIIEDLLLCFQTPEIFWTDLDLPFSFHITVEKQHRKWRQESLKQPCGKLG